MRFEEAYKGWTEKRLSQSEAAEILGVCDRTFRRYVQRFEGDGIEGLIDYRLHQVSQRRAPVDEVIALTTLYTTRYSGWNTRHFVSEQPSHSTRSKIYGNATFNGNNASMRLLGQAGNFSRVSFSQA